MTSLDLSEPLGATRTSDRTVRFRVWAPTPKVVELDLLGDAKRRTTMTPLGEGYVGVDVGDVPPGSRYGYRLDGGPLRADPASRSQPADVEGPSAIVAPEQFVWSDHGWAGIAREQLVFYELHVGTFSSSGTFAGVADRLDALHDLGISAIELLPVAAFPGTRNWGYDGVFPFAVQHSYGGIAGLQQLSDACHARELALIVDVVYNHVGPEGSHLEEFGPYFTAGYRTPWGAALNFDGAGSDHVRRYFLESAAYLVREGHLDGLRVDAIHAIIDPTAQPFLAELADRIHAIGTEQGRLVHMIAESSLNDPRVVLPRVRGGLGFDALWNDDFHHAFHSRVTGERDGYYADFVSPESIPAALRDAFVLTGQYSAYRGRRHGASAGDLGPDHFVVCVQNHDQIGNRPFGERLSALVPFEPLKLAAGFLLLSPYLPLLFMGEEYGETAPFLYFTSHHDPQLGIRVREGRRAGFPGHPNPEKIPDPQSLTTFERSRIDFDRRERPGHRELLDLYRHLLSLRRALGARARWRPEDIRSLGPENSVVVTFPAPGARPAVVVIYHFGTTLGSQLLPFPEGTWQRRLDSSDRRWAGPGSRLPDLVDSGSAQRLELNPFSFGVFDRSR